MALPTQQNQILNLSRHNLSRALTVLTGSAQLSGYQGGKDGIEWVPTMMWRPKGSNTLAFTAGVAAGAISATLTGNWAPPTGFFPATLSTGQVLNAYCTSGSTAVTFWAQFAPTQPLQLPTAQVTAAATSAVVFGNYPPQATTAAAYAASQSIGAAASAVINGSSIGSITIAGNTYNPAGIPDVPRNVVGAWTTSSTVTVSGFDYYGNAQTETQTGTTFTGKKAFMAIISITSTASITAATFGYGSVLGMPFVCNSGDFMGAYENDLVDAGTFVKADFTIPATSATGDVRGTYTPAGALNGAKFINVEYRVADVTTQLGAFGVTPA